MKLIRKYYIIILSLIISFLFLSICYSYDNKYTTPPPYGKDGAIALKEQNIHNKVHFLIDGWGMYEGKQSPKTIKNKTPITYTYIGEYSRFNMKGKMSPWKCFFLKSWGTTPST